VSQPLVDENGFLRGLPHHDGFVLGVLIDEADRDVRIAIQSADKETRAVLVVRRPRMFVMNNFREGNTILNIRLVDAARSDAAAADIHSILAGRADFPGASIGESIFILESSFGADIISICRGLEVEIDSKFVVK